MSILPEIGRSEGRTCHHLLLTALLLASALTAAASTGWPRHPGVASAQEPPTIGIDANPVGNKATSLGKIDPCVARSTGETFQVDIFVRNVEQLLAWEIYVEYDPNLLEVVARQVDLFQAANAGSNVFDVSDRVPDADGLYRLAAADISDPPTPDSGSGVLAKLTLRAKAPGISPLTLAYRDLNGDGKPDQGPLLRDIDAKPIGDDDGDALFDGQISNAQVAIDTPCSEAPSPPTENDSAGNGSSAWIIPVAAAAGVALLALASLGALGMARRRHRA